MRNPNGLAWQPQSGALWTTVNERDELGNDLVPDYMTSVRDGAFYGWPYSYYGQHVDTRINPPRPDLVSQAIARITRWARIQPRSVWLFIVPICCRRNTPVVLLSASTVHGIASRIVVIK